MTRWSNALYSMATLSRLNWSLKCWHFRMGENRSTRRKTSRTKDENQQQTQPTYDAETGNRTRTTLVGGECSHHCAIPAPLRFCRSLFIRSFIYLFIYLLFRMDVCLPFTRLEDYAAKAQVTVMPLYKNITELVLKCTLYSHYFEYFMSGGVIQ